MSRVLKWVLLACYYYSLSIGLLRFWYDHKRQSVYTTRTLTVYSVMANIGMFCMVPVIFHTSYVQTLKSRSSNLHEVLYIIMLLVRTATVFINILFNWMYRHESVALIRRFHEIHRQFFVRHPMRPQALRLFSTRIVSKICTTVLADTLMFLLSLATLPNHLDWQTVASIGGVLMLTNCLNLFMNHYFISMMSIAQNLHTLNVEISRIMRTADALDVSCRRRGFFVDTCCRLADELDEIAAILSCLNRLAQRVGRIFNFQFIFNMVNLHVNNIILLFMLYTIARDRQNVVVSTFASVLMCGSVFFYYADLFQMTHGITEALKAYQRTVHLLHSATPCAFLDIRLERSIQSFSLQLAINPFKISLLGMINFDWIFIFSVFTSTFTRTLFLMQYDMKYFSGPSNVQ